MNIGTGANQLAQSVKSFFAEHVKHMTADTLSWITVLVLHAATVPSILAVMAGLTDRTPALDLVLFVWAGLTLLFIRAALLRDMLNLVTIGLGFVVQATLLASILFV
jgi:hypothetical protein